MEKYLKKFENHTQYEAFTATTEFIKPNVSYCVQENKVHFNPKTWADEYLTTVALEDGTISFNIWKNMGTKYITSISYSTDNGETWTTTNNTNGKSEPLTISVNVNEGDKVLWKGYAQQTGYFDEDENDSLGSFFSSTAEFDVQGNVMSLLYGDEFIDKTTLNDYEFTCLFCNFYQGTECNVVNARNLSLPATTLTQSCYEGMFEDCTSLITAPELPTTTLADGCYQFMFQNCTALTTAPKLPATTLAEGCYYNMFYGCTSLTTAPELLATTLATQCYGYMFYGCTSLNCIKAMFTTTPSAKYTRTWVSHIAASSTFVNPHCS